MKTKVWMWLSIALPILFILLCFTNEIMFGLLCFYILPFPLCGNYLSWTFWVITIGLIIAYILRKKNIGSNRWRWVALFSMETFGLVFANVESRWGYVPVKYGWGALGLAECEIARRGVVFFSLQLIATLIMFFYFRKKRMYQSPKPPKQPERPFCGDI